MPMVLITGQKAIRTARQARFQIVDIVATMKPLTKSSRQIVSAETIPTLVRDAFRTAQEERPGPAHLELPEDVAGEEADAALVPPHPIEIPVADPAALDRAAALIGAAQRPLVMLGASASRPRLADALSAFVKRTRIPFFNTQMGKGSVAGGSNLYMGTAALSERDYLHTAIDRADLIVAIDGEAIGVDLAQEAPPAPQEPAVPAAPEMPAVPKIKKIETIRIVAKDKYGKITVTQDGDDAPLRVSARRIVMKDGNVLITDRAIPEIPEISSATCGGDKGDDVKIESREGDKRRIVICTDRIEMRAADVAARARIAEATAGRARAIAIASADMGKRHAMLGLRMARRSIEAQADLSAAQKSAALKGIDDAIRELESAMD